MKFGKARNKDNAVHGWRAIQENYYSCLALSGWREVYEYPSSSSKMFGLSFLGKLSVICFFCPMINAHLAYSTILEAVPLADRFLSISLWLEQCQSFCKIVYMMAHLKRFKRLILTFTDFDCVRLNEEKAFATMSTISEKLGRLRKYWFLTCGVALLGFYLPPVYFTPRALLYGENARNMTKVFPSSYPFNVEQPPVPLFVYLFELVAGYGFVIHFAQINFFFVTVAVLLCGMFTLLNETLTSSSADIRKYIRDHQRLLWTATELRRLLSPIVLGQLFISCVNFSLSIVLVVKTSQDSMSFIFKNITYTIITFGSLVYFCWLSSLLETATESTRDYIYMNDWHKILNRVDGQTMIVMTMRGLRPVRLTAMGLLDLKLGTFIDVIRVAYSFFTILKRL